MADKTQVVTIRVDIGPFVRAIRSVREALTPAIRAFARHQAQFARREHNRIHHRREVPARSAMHAMYRHRSRRRKRR